MSNHLFFKSASILVPKEQQLNIWGASYWIYILMQLSRELKDQSLKNAFIFETRAYVSYFWDLPNVTSKNGQGLNIIWKHLRSSYMIMTWGLSKKSWPYDKTKNNVPCLRDKNSPLSVEICNECWVRCLGVLQLIEDPTTLSQLRSILFHIIGQKVTNWRMILCLMDFIGKTYPVLPLMPGKVFPTRTASHSWSSRYSEVCRCFLHVAHLRVTTANKKIIQEHCTRNTHGQMLG